MINTLTIDWEHKTKLSSIYIIKQEQTSLLIRTCGSVQSNVNNMKMISSEELNEKLLCTMIMIITSMAAL